MNKKLILFIGILGILILSACSKTDSQIEQERNIDITRNEEGCFVVCWDDSQVKCGQPCPKEPELTKQLASVEMKPILGTTCQTQQDCLNKYVVTFTSCSCSWTLKTPESIGVDCEQVCPQPIENKPTSTKCINNVCNLRQETEGGDAFLPIEERLSETAKQVCADTGGEVIIRNKNEVCQCSESNIEGTTNKFSPTRGCNPFCDNRGFRINECPPPDSCVTGKEPSCVLTVCGTPKCVEIPAKELCENSDGIWRTDMVFVPEMTKDERDIASCQCPEGSIGYTPHFGCNYRVGIMEVNSLFSIYPIR